VHARLARLDGRRGFLLSLRDLAQAEALMRETRRVDQLAVLGTLAASVVHEIGGAVQAVQTLVDLLAPRLAADGDGSRYLERIQAELERVRRLADEIRTLAQVE